MADDGIKGKVSLDTSEYQKGISEMNRQIRVIESGFKSSAAALGDWGNSADGLKLRMEALTKQIDVQERKVNAVREEYERVARAKGENSIAAEELKIKLNRETESLNKLQTELKQTGPKLNDLEREAGQSAAKMDTLERETEGSTRALGIMKGVAAGMGGILAGVGLGLIGLAGIAAGIALGIGKLGVNSAQASDDLLVLSEKTGISVERLQELGFIGSQVGVEVDTIRGSLSKLIRSMDADPTSEQAEAFKTLGVNTRDASGKLLDSETVFENVLSALGKVDNETERDALAMTLLGKTALELNPLIKTSTDELAAMAKKAHEVGAVMSEEDVRAGAEFSDQLDTLKLGFKGVAGTIGAAFMPMFSGLATVAGGYLRELAGVVKGSDGDLGAMASGVGALAGRIVQDLAKQAPELARGAVVMVQGIAGGFQQALPVLLPAVMSILTMVVRGLVQGLPGFLRMGVEIVLTLLKGIVPQLPMLLTAGIEAIIALVNGISQALPELIPIITQAIVSMVQVLLQNLPQLIAAGVLLILAVIEGLSAALPQLISAAPMLMQTLVDALVLSTPLLLAAAAQIIVALGSALVGSLPALWETGIQMMTLLVQAIVDGLGINLPALYQAATQILVALRNGLQAVVSQLQEIGVSIVDGIWKGMQKRAGVFRENVLNFFRAIIDEVKRTLGIASPSKVFAGIGLNMAAGLSQGFLREIGNVERNISQAVSGLSGGLGNAVGVGAGGGGVNYYQSFYAPVVVQDGAQIGPGLTPTAKKF